MAFTDKEIKLAEDMRRKGAKFQTIARALGRRSHDGIRRHLDPAYHERRNTYMAKWMRENSKRSL